MPSPSRFLRAAAALCLCAAAALAETGAPAAAADPSALTAALVARGEARRAAGLTREALADFARAAETAPSASERAFAAAAYGVALREAGRAGEAEIHLRAALADAGDQPGVRAVAAATLARMIAGVERTETTAMRAARLDEAAALAAAARAAAAEAGPIPAAIAALAGAEVGRARGDEAAARAALSPAVESLAGREGAAPMLVELGDAAFAAGDPALADRAYAAAEADAAGGPAVAAAALGRGEAALALGAAEQALAAADRARRHAILHAVEHVHFAADWLSARALARLGRARQAEAAYASAFEGLRDYRARLPLGAPPATSARRFAGRAFQLDYIDFLFGARRDAPALRSARDLVEDLKLDEIDDYFAERCTPARGRSQAADRLGDGVAVLYPIVFADRTEMIWTIGERIGGYRIEVSADELRRRITALRYQIDLRIGGVEPLAGALHDLILGPLAAELAAGARTIVVAPDGPLRALPFAALWTGEAYLGARFGLATILGLNLIDQGEPALDEARVLAAGAEEVSPDYAPLPSVPLELAAIRDVFGAEILAEAAFSAEALAGEIARRPYDVVHIATHAEFGATPADNFILTSGGRLDVTRLEATLRARAVQTDAPVSLLTLSACNTAADLGGEAAERAPLGLAGVGFRAGARSVLASLWPAEDDATARLMTRFYEELRGGAGRAEALRRAQAALIDDPETADPFQWANFILIGDWR